MTSTSAHERTNQGLGTLIFLLSETLFFGVLILVFFFFKGTANPADLTGRELINPWRAAVFTIALVLSSFTMIRAERKLRAGNRHGFRDWLVITIALGCIFLFGQITEYTGLWGQGVTISSNLFGTQFYTLTGLHFLHVSAGVLMLLILLGFAWRGRATEPGHAAVESISYYWHFVDIVWVVLLAAVYFIGA